ncbi:hypothetical protein M436DRAFT_81394 [Aureobasidium namibiae CBS 147.97]|uniref:F-box domain-containing protein n=1 Tax=Aureobasidium namibiae CBS 147.97 TaxID=1043004 RepID=A0A074XHC8_9PEZI
MASSAPQEILALIVDHLAQLNEKLSPYALVNKSWQAAFERRIYSSVVVRSSPGVTDIRVKGWPKFWEPHNQQGLSLEIFINITNGPQDWQQARRTYVRKIFYGVAVPYWLDEVPETDGDYAHDKFCRRKNNQAFSKSVCRLFEHLSTWTDQKISLRIALQAEDASTDEQSGEQESTSTTGTGEEITRYRAEFVSGYPLPRASCITSLEITELLTGETVWSELWASDEDVWENKISLPACLRIASACGALKEIYFDGGDGEPLAGPNMRLARRTAAAKEMSRLPRTVKDVYLFWNSPSKVGIADVRRPNESASQDLFCATLHKFSMQLQHLRTSEMEIFPELFCPVGLELPIEAHWPYLETLHLDRVCAYGPFSDVARHADGTPKEDPLAERYVNDLYTSLGHAVQKMPRLKSMKLSFGSLAHGLDLWFKNEQWNLTLCVFSKSQPSPEFTKAWKVPGGSLQPYTFLNTQKATYSSWPPS